MPVKWTPDKDQQLLLKILETHNLHVDPKKVAEAWPEDEDKPTPRAITERLVKIRQIAKANGAAHFGVSSSQSKKVGAPRSVITTPRKSPPSTSEAFTPLSPSSTSKRKREDAPNMHATADTTPTARPKPEPESDDDILIISDTPIRSFNFPATQTNPKSSATPSTPSFRKEAVGTRFVAEDMESPSKFPRPNGFLKREKQAFVTECFSDDEVGI